MSVCVGALTIFSFYEVVFVWGDGMGVLLGDVRGVSELFVAGRGNQQAGGAGKRGQATKGAPCQVCSLVGCNGLAQLGIWNPKFLQGKQLAAAFYFGA